MTLVYFAIAWLAGIALAKTISLPWQVFPLLGLAAFLGLLLWRDDHRVRLGALCALMLALGAGRLLLAVPHFDKTSLATYNDIGWATLEGVVVGEPDERELYTNLRVRAERLRLPDGTELEVEGLVLVTVNRYPQRRYGDRVQVEGRLETPSIFEEFSYREYLARQSIHSLIRYAQVTLLAENQASPLLYHLFAFKRHAQSTIASILPEPQAALLTGILLGVETGIPDDLMNDFSATGTTHIIAISGFNITIISGILAGLARHLFSQPFGSTRGKRWAVWVAVAGVAVYTVFVGASAAVVRAALMGMLYLWGRYLGRPAFAPISLAVAAIVMTVLNPYTLWDVGFQLSFAATAGLVLYAEPLGRTFEWALARVISTERAQGIAGLVNEALIVTLAAQITTTPIILYYFRRLSLVTLVTNFLILPAQVGVMICGGIATLLGLVSRPLGQAAGWIAWVFLTYTIETVRLTAQIPFASRDVRMEGWMVWGTYAFLGGLTWWLAQPRERRGELWARLFSRLETKVLAGAAAILLVLVFFVWRSLPDGRLHVVFLDVGQGDAIFIQTPSGRQVLVDGGPSEMVLLSQLGRQMPFWDRTLDMMILTHPDTDHVTGLVPVLERYQVDTVIFREVGHESEVYEYWLQALQAEGAMVYSGESGLRLMLDEGLEMVVLHPGAELVGGSARSTNNNSIVTRLTYGQVSMLLPGDIEAQVEHRLVMEEATLASTVLKAAHHGGCSSTTHKFLDAVGPAVVVISVGADNDFGHPCAEVLERLELALSADRMSEVEGRLPVYRTDEQGVIEVISDGVRVWVETER